MNKIKKFLPLKTNDSNSNNNDSENIVKDNIIIFEKNITSKNDKITVKELNQLLQFLIFVKKQGNFTAHPSKEKNFILNPDKKEIKLKNNDDINSISKKLEDKLKIEYVKRNFEITINPSIIFNCLFENKFNSLINAKNNPDLEKKINVLLKKSLEGIEEPRIENLLTNFSQGIEKLEEISKTLGNFNNIKNDEKFDINKQLNEIFNRIDKILNKNNAEKKILSFLNNLNNYGYESSVTGEKKLFFSRCLGYLLKGLCKKINIKIREFQKDKNNMEILINSKERTIFRYLKIISDNIFKNFINEIKTKLKKIFYFLEIII